MDVRERKQLTGELCVAGEHSTVLVVIPVLSDVTCFLAHLL